MSLLELYPKLVQYIRKLEAIEGSISQDTFVRYLSPLQKVDWNSPTLKKSNLSGRKNDNVRHLVMWMWTAIHTQSQGTVEEILDRDIRSVPGKGLIANPSLRKFGRRLVVNGQLPATQSSFKLNTLTTHSALLGRCAG